LATAAHGTSELECARQQVQKPPEKRLT
jgi:hypothetical protein